MPRRARLSVAGIPWHIIQRGNNRAVCFHAEADYRRYLDDLAEQSRRFGCTVHAYVLRGAGQQTLRGADREAAQTSGNARQGGAAEAHLEADDATNARMRI